MATVSDVGMFQMGKVFLTLGIMTQAAVLDDTTVVMIYMHGQLFLFLFLPFLSFLVLTLVPVLDYPFMTHTCQLTLYLYDSS